jgi:hypothetical protein
VLSNPVSRSCFQNTVQDALPRPAKTLYDTLRRWVQRTPVGLGN